jgi:hypothetical protein
VAQQNKTVPCSNEDCTNRVRAGRHLTYAAKINGKHVCDDCFLDDCYKKALERIDGGIAKEVALRSD